MWERVAARMREGIVWVSAIVASALTHLSVLVPLPERESGL